MGNASDVRRAIGELGVDAAERDYVRLLGPSYTTALTDASVLFRVQSVRRDKSVACTFSSQDMAVHTGDQLMGHFEGRGWRVSMVYHNLEFFVLHDEHVAHVCVVLSPPALPRCGSDTLVSSQFYMELVRQRLTQGLLDGTYSTADLKALIPRPSSHRIELRRFKGDNAMNPALAHTLLTYAAIEEGMVVLDPFVGCGTLLVEAAASTMTRVGCVGSHMCRATRHAHRAGHSPCGLVLLGGECSHKDVVRTQQNLRLSHLVELTAAHGLVRFDERNSNDDHSEVRQAVGDSFTAWVSQVVADAASLDVRSSLSVAKPLDATDAQTQRLEKAVQRATSAASPLAGAYVFTSFVGDATKMPLRDETVDRIVTDMPFGRRCGNHTTNRRLYPSFLRECHRVLRRPQMHSSGRTTAPCEWRVAAADPHRLSRVRELAQDSPGGGGGGRAVLLTIEGRLLYESLAEVHADCPFQLVTEPFAVDMGGLFPYVFVLDKI